MGNRYVTHGYIALIREHYRATRAAYMCNMCLNMENSDIQSGLINLPPKLEG